MSPRMLKWLGLFLFLALGVLFPIIAGTGGPTTLLEEIFAFGTFAISYDLLIGYTGVISFGHAVFFGTGAYTVAVFLTRGNGSTASLVYGVLCALAFSVILSLLISLLSLRIRETYFAMITLAVGQTFFVLAGSQALRHVTNGNDGMSVFGPKWLNSDMSIYYLCLAILVLSLLVIRRFVHSPVGHVLQGIRENEGRASALGFPVVQYKTVAFTVSGCTATLAGVGYAIAQAFVSTGVYDVSLSLNVLLMTIIGGIGTLYGGLIGAVIITAAQVEFGNLAGTHPFFTHSTIIFGVLYILVVRFLPRGILGTLFRWKGLKAWTKLSPSSNKHPA